MGYVFISYSSRDKDLAAKLAADLSAQGLEVWLDKRKITGLQPYWSEIQTGIESATHFLFLISPDSIQESSGAHTELFHAAALSPRPIIVPVMARPTPLEKVPIVITPGKYQIHDVPGLGYADAFQRILNVVANARNTPAPVRQSTPMSANDPTGAYRIAPPAARPAQDERQRSAAPPAQPRSAQPTAVSGLRPVTYGTAPTPTRPPARRSGMSTGAIIGFFALIGVVGIGAVILFGPDILKAVFGNGVPVGTATATILVEPTATATPVLEIATATTCQIRVTTDTLNVREGPDPAFRRLTQLVNNETAPVVGFNETRPWWKVRANGVEGWVAQGDLREIFIVTEGDCSAVPRVELPPTPTAAPTDIPFQPTVTPIDLPTVLPTETPIGISTYVPITTLVGPIIIIPKLQPTATATNSN